MKLGRNVCLKKSRTSLKKGHVGSKSRSLSQILHKLCVLSGGHNYGLILVKLGQNVSLDEISDDCEIGLCWVKNLVSRSNPT